MLFHQNKSTTISNTQEVKAIWISCLVQYEILSDLLQRKYLVDKGKLSNNARLGKLKKKTHTVKKKPTWIYQNWIEVQTKRIALNYN